jgi:hypothetical protein
VLFAWPVEERNGKESIFYWKRKTMSTSQQCGKKTCNPRGKEEKEKLNMNKNEIVYANQSLSKNFIYVKNQCDISVGKLYVFFFSLGFFFYLSYTVLDWN